METVTNVVECDAECGVVKGTLQTDERIIGTVSTSFLVHDPKLSDTYDVRAFAHTTVRKQLQQATGKEVYITFMNEVYLKVGEDWFCFLQYQKELTISTYYR
jgi:hypothetical protein